MGGSKRQSRFRLPFSQDETRITLKILRSSRMALAGLVIAVGFVILAITMWLSGRALLPYNPYTISTSQILQAPSLSHLFGTDVLGRDILSRVMAAAPVDGEVATAVIVIGVFLGLVTGSLAGYLGGAVEEVIMRVTDIFLAFPSIILALAISASLGPSTINSIFALAPVWWPSYTRLVRGETLSIKSQEYVEAARASGQKTRNIILRHVIPNILPVTLVYATLDIGNVIIVFSVLSFIGLGAQPPAPEWGLMAVQNEQYLVSAPWAPIFPALAIFVVAVGFSLLGDGLRDAFDPKTRSLFS